MIMNIYFITSEPFSTGQYKRHGLDFLKKHGISLKAINLTFISQEKYNKDEKKRFLNIAEKNQVFCYSEKDVFTELEKISINDIVFYHVAQIHRFIFNYILEYLNQKKIKYGFMSIMSTPNLNHPLWMKIIINIEGRSKLFRLGLRRFKKQKTIPNFKPSFVISAGQTVYNNFKATFGSKPSYFNTESMDFSRAMLLDNTVIESFKHKKYILFIEQGDPFHPDFKLLKMELESDPVNYYKRINLFISEMEIKTGLEVLISLPPKTETFMPELTEMFKDRQFYINKTAELAKYCQFVMIEYSTAINFAVIFRKPVFFFSIRNKGYSYNATKNMAKIFGKRVSIVGKNDWNLNIEDLMKIDYNSYNQFKNNWIKSSGALPLNKNVPFLNFLKKIKNG